MDKKFLHLTGPQFSRIIAGAWRWNNVAVDQLIATSLDCGITTFDHADIYGDYENEKIFGAALKNVGVSRQEIQLVTKCGIKLLSGKQPNSWVKHYDTSKEHILASVDRSLQNLGTDYIDLLLIHRPDPMMDPEETSEAFGLLKQNGKVLHFGVSNFSAAQFEMLQSFLPFPLVTNQIEWSLSRLQAMYDGTIDVLMKHRVAPMAWSPLGGGKLMSASADLFSAKSKYGATDMQMSLAWLLKHPSGVLPVIGTTQPDRIRESAKAIDIVLDRQDWFQMLKVAMGADVP